jgi:hypothetical protein
MRRWLGIGLLVSAAALAVWYFVDKPKRITFRAYVSIQDGMTEREVWTILGRETLSYPASEQFYIPPEAAQVVRRCAWWSQEHAFIIVGYDEEERVRWKVYTAR